MAEPHAPAPEPAAGRYYLTGLPRAVQDAILTAPTGAELAGEIALIRARIAELTSAPTRTRDDDRLFVQLMQLLTHMIATQSRVTAQGAELAELNDVIRRQLITLHATTTASPASRG
jgi:hypothetical protein